MKQAVVGRTLSATDASPLRRALDLCTGRAAVLTTARDGQRFGITASSVVHSDEGGPILVWVDNQRAHLTEAVLADKFVVNVLGDDQRALAERFAAGAERTIQQVRSHTGRSGMPRLADALAHIECELTEHLVGPVHSVLVGRILSADLTGPLQRGLTRGPAPSAFTPDDEVYALVRERVLNRVYAAEEIMLLDDVADELHVERPALFYALTRLTCDRFVRWDPDLGYMVAEFDARMSEDTFDAFLAIELGAIDLAVESASSTDVAELRQLFENMASLLVRGRIVDFGTYLLSSQAFHERLVACSGSSTLVSTFSELGSKALLTRNFGCGYETSRQLIDAQRELLQAIERSDGQAARVAARRHCQVTKAYVREILAHTGGRL